MKQLKLRDKILLPISIIVVLIFVVLITVVTTRSSNMAEEMAFDVSEQTAHRYGNVVDAELEIAMDAARTLAQSLEGIKQYASPERDDTNAMLREVLKENPNFIGVWTCWEPNAFDGRDSAFVNTPGHDETGRFIPYWNRGSGKIILEPLMDYTKTGAGDYYLIPLKTGKETIFDPFLYPVAGEEVLMTSLVVPIKVNGKSLGVAGIDIPLSNFNQWIEEIVLYENGYGGVVSNDGTIVAHKDESQVGKNILNRGNTEKRREYLEAITDGDVYHSMDQSIFLDEEVYRVFVPINVGKAETPWSFYINVPTEEILAPVHNIRNFVILFTVISLFVLVGIIIFIADKISSPIKGIVSDVSSAINQLSSSTAEHERIMNQQTSSVNETSTTMEELGISSQQSAEQSDKAADEAEQVLQLSERGVKEMVDARNAVSTLREKVEDIAQQILHLSEQISQISDITAIVTDIANQVNLLALNASVEAARAGEQGKGFAVVASEIRKLADESRKSAEKINELVNDIQKATNSTVMVTEEGTKTVEAVTNAAQKSTRTFSEITNSANNAAESVQQIAMNIQQQAAAINQVVQAMNSINSGAKETAAGLKQTKVGIEKVNDATQELNEMV